MREEEKGEEEEGGGACKAVAVMQPTLHSIPPGIHKYNASGYGLFRKRNGAPTRNSWWTARGCMRAEQGGGGSRGRSNRGFFRNAR